MKLSKIKREIFFLFKKIVPVSFSMLFNDEVVLVVLNSNLRLVLSVLKLHINTQYKVLSCVSGVDLLKDKFRYVVVYELVSLLYNARLRVKVYVNEFCSVNSVVNVYRNADWWEREVWDCFGVFFVGHKDLRRILTDYGFEGYPLRKDFPLSGYTEVRYDYEKKRIVLEAVELSQEYRYFSFDNPW